VARYGWEGCALRPVVPLLLTLSLAWPVGVSAAKADSKTKGSKVPDVTREVEELLEAQRSLAVSLSELRDQVSELQRSVGEGRDDARSHHDALQGAIEQIKGMREEVRGLYVESSGLKGDIAQLGKQVEGLDGSLASFRLSAGIVVAVAIVLQIALVGLMLRGRG
jgi:predicted  nucleic acid-binding Zn-ribbon protein